MSSKFDQKQERDVPQSEAGVMQLLLSMADTTWRMFTPAIILVPAGIFTDLKLHTKPWVTVVCVPLALWLSAMLVKKQLREVR
jgi:hypothetical protein